MSKPRRPRNARPAQKPAAAGPGAAEPLTPVSEAEGPFVDPAESEAPEPAVAAFEAADEITEEATTFALDTVTAGEAVAEPVPEAVAQAAPRPIRQPIAAPTSIATSFGTTVMNYVIGEGEAFAAHMRALAGARSVAEFVRLQIGEFQRAADATLTCWGILTVAASRTASLR